MTRDDQPEFRATVTDRTMVTPHMVRITCSNIEPLGEEATLGAGAFADEFFGLWVPECSGSAHEESSVKRYYTVREWRAETREIDIDMLLHGVGPATQWAARVQAGDVVSFDKTRGHYHPPAHAGWIGLCGDATALPAIGRILDERASAAHSPPAHVVVTVDEASDRQDLVLRDGDTIRWVQPDELVAQTLALTQNDDPGYLWFSGEASDMRAVRKHVRHTLRWTSERWTTMGYWRRDSERWMARFEAEGPRLRARLEEIYTSDDDEQVQADLAEELLEQRGLL